VYPTLYLLKCFPVPLNLVYYWRHWLRSDPPTSCRTDTTERYWM